MFISVSFCVTGLQALPTDLQALVAAGGSWKRPSEIFALQLEQRKSVLEAAGQDSSSEKPLDITIADPVISGDGAVRAIRSGFVHEHEQEAANQALSTTGAKKQDAQGRYMH